MTGDELRQAARDLRARGGDIDPAVADWIDGICNPIGHERRTVASDDEVRAAINVARAFTDGGE